MKKKQLYDRFTQVREKIDGFKEYIDKQIEDAKQPEPKIRVVPPVSAEEKSVSISSWTILKAALIVFATYYFLQWLGSIADILLIMFAALVISSAFIPVVDYFQKYRIPRAVTVLAIYILFFSLCAFVISGIVPFLITQLNDAAEATLNMIRQVSTSGFQGIPYGDRLNVGLEYFGKEKVISQLQASIQGGIAELGNYSSSALQFITSALSNIVRAILVLVLTFYMILEKDAISDFFKSITTGPHQAWFINRSNEIITKMGDWLRGQILLSCSVGVASYIGLLIIGNPFALTLGFLTALLEFIPYVGAFMAGAIAVIVSSTVSPFAGIATIILYVMIQFLENNLLVPLIMRRATGLSPVVTIFAVLVAVKLIGGPGIILAIPIAAAVSVIINSLRN